MHDHKDERRLVQPSPVHGGRKKSPKSGIKRTRGDKAYHKTCPARGEKKKDNAYHRPGREGGPLLASRQRTWPVDERKEKKEKKGPRAAPQPVEEKGDAEEKRGEGHLPRRPENRGGCHQDDGWRCKKKGGGDECTTNGPPRRGKVGGGKKKFT